MPNYKKKRFQDAMKKIFTSLENNEKNDMSELESIILDEGVEYEALLKQQVKGIDREYSKTLAFLFVISAEAGNLNLVKKFLADEPNLLNAVDHTCKLTALMAAAKENHLAIVDYLLSKNAVINMCDNNGLSALGFAVACDNIEIAKRLMDKGANVNEQNNEGNGALHQAIYNNNEELAKLLFEKGADPNIINLHGICPLIFALQLNQPKLVELLLAQPKLNINLSSKDKSSSPLLVLLSLNFEDNAEKYIQTFLDKGANVFFKTIADQDALTVAIDTGRVKCFSVLLEHINKLNRGEVKPNLDVLLHMAIENNRLEIATLLINFGANVNALNALGTNYNYLINAVKAVNVDFFKILLENGACPDAVDRLGYTALLYLSQYGNLKKAELGYISTDWMIQAITAKLQGLKKILVLLIQYGAKYPEILSGETKAIFCKWRDLDNEECIDNNELDFVYNEIMQDPARLFRESIKENAIQHVNEKITKNQQAIGADDDFVISCKKYFSGNDAMAALEKVNSFMVELNHNMILLKQFFNDDNNKPFILASDQYFIENINEFFRKKNPGDGLLWLVNFFKGLQAEVKVKKLWQEIEHKLLAVDNLARVDAGAMLDKNEVISLRLASENAYAADSSSRNFVENARQNERELCILFEKLTLVKQHLDSRQDNLILINAITPRIFKLINTLSIKNTDQRAKNFERLCKQKHNLDLGAVYSELSMIFTQLKNRSEKSAKPMSKKIIDLPTSESDQDVSYRKRAQAIDDQLRLSVEEYIKSILNHEITPSKIKQQLKPAKQTISVKNTKKPKQIKPAKVTRDGLLAQLLSHYQFTKENDGNSKKTTLDTVLTDNQNSAGDVSSSVCNASSSRFYAVEKRIFPNAAKRLDFIKYAEKLGLFVRIAIMRPLFPIASSSSAPPDMPWLWQHIIDIRDRIMHTAVLFVTDVQKQQEIVAHLDAIMRRLQSAAMDIEPELTLDLFYSNTIPALTSGYPLRYLKEIAEFLQQSYHADGSPKDAKVPPFAECYSLHYTISLLLSMLSEYIKKKHLKWKIEGSNLESILELRGDFAHACQMANDSPFAQMSHINKYTPQLILEWITPANINGWIVTLANNASQKNAALRM